MKKLKNQVRNEIFRQLSLTLTLTLPLDVPVHPMDAKGLSSVSASVIVGRSSKSTVWLREFAGGPAEEAKETKSNSGTQLELLRGYQEKPDKEMIWVFYQA